MGWGTGGCDSAFAQPPNSVNDERALACTHKHTHNPNASQTNAKQTPRNAHNSDKPEALKRILANSIKNQTAHTSDLQSTIKRMRDVPYKARMVPMRGEAREKQVDLGTLAQGPGR